jgi:hypothetical protein
MLQHQEELKQPVMLGATKGGPKPFLKGTLEGNRVYINKGTSDVESILRVESTDWEESELDMDRAVVVEVVVEVENWVAPNKLYIV